jgi:putrescine carbamoyltransferase
MARLGGHALHLQPAVIHAGQRESLEDTADVLERMVDVIEVRALPHSRLLRLAQRADVPVINGRSDYNHPAQALCDVLTMMEHCGGKPLRELNVTFVGAATSVCNSLAALCTRMGMHFTHAAPARYQLGAAVVALATANGLESGGTLRVTDDVHAAVANADFLYTDLWWGVGEESQIPERHAAFMPKFQVNAALLRLAPPGCKVLHCLPASRGVEATDEILDAPCSVIFDQAENRLHMEMALLVRLVYPRLRRASAALRAYHAGLIENLLAGDAG